MVKCKTDLRSKRRQYRNRKSSADLHKRLMNPAHRNQGSHVLRHMPSRHRTHLGRLINLACFVQSLKPHRLSTRTTVTMVSKLFLVAAILAATVQAARVQFWTTRDSCAGLSSEDYQNVPCNTCVDPPFGERVPRSRHFVSNYSPWQIGMPRRLLGLGIHGGRVTARYGLCLRRRLP